MRDLRSAPRPIPDHRGIDPPGDPPDRRIPPPAGASTVHEEGTDSAGTTSLLAFAAFALGMALTLGRTWSTDLALDLSGARAGLISLGGVALGFVVYMLCAAFGITALVLAVPYAYDAIRIVGAFYLLWLAWQAVRPGELPLRGEGLPPDSPGSCS